MGLAELLGTRISPLDHALEGYRACQVETKRVRNSLSLTSASKANWLRDQRTELQVWADLIVQLGGAVPVEKQDPPPPPPPAGQGGGDGKEPVNVT